jgi:phosphohistidine phosphatase
MTDKRLVLIRHAKAVQGAPDRSRTLSERGRTDAAAIGRWLREMDVVPDLAVISPSTRTMQTWQLAAEVLGVSVRAVHDARVWHNKAASLLDIVAEQEDDVATVAIVGHNPSMHSLAVDLAGSSDELAEFPTSTVAVFAAPQWRHWDAAELVAVATCRG